jgi:hypothetical protein
VFETPGAAREEAHVVRGLLCAVLMRRAPGGYSGLLNALPFVVGCHGAARVAFAQGFGFAR